MWLRKFTLKLENYALTLLIFSILGLAVLQIILRNFFDSGFTWSEPTLRALVLWLGLVGAIAACNNKRHIKIELFSFGSSWLNQLSNAITDLATTIICALLAWFSSGLISLDYEFSTKFLPGIPSWCVEIIMPFAFGVIAMKYLIYFIQDIRALSGSGAT